MTTTQMPPAPTADTTTHALWIDVPEIAQRVFSATMLRGGASVSTTTPDDVPSAGYAVALADREERVPLADFTVANVDAYVRKHVDATTLPGIYVGAWYDADTDDVFLDLSMIFGDRDVAERIGREASQLAIWDFTAQAEIRL